MKKLLFSVTRKDFDRQTFSVGGHGGGGKDTSNSGVRLIHRASGAVGEGREHRSNTMNERSALKKLAATEKFQRWLQIEAARQMGQACARTQEEILRDIDDELRRGDTIVTETYDPSTKEYPKEDKCKSPTSVPPAR